MLEVSTAGIAASTIGNRVLPGAPFADYRLQMVDISSCEDFADFLNRLMEAEKLDRAAVGKLLGVQRAMVSKYFKKGSKPSDDKLHMIAARYPVYDFNSLHDMVHGKKREQQDHAVRTEYGAKVGRIAESIQDETLRFALLQLISSLERDARKGTGTK